MYTLNVQINVLFKNKIVKNYYFLPFFKLQICTHNGSQNDVVLGISRYLFIYQK